MVSLMKVAKGDILVCSPETGRNDYFTPGFTYTVERVKSKREGLVELIDDNGNYQIANMNDTTGWVFECVSK